MSFQSDIFTGIQSNATMNGLIEDRFSWDIADGPTPPPFLVAQVISGAGETPHDGSREIALPLIQFTAWAKSKAEAITIMAAFKGEFEGTPFAGDSDVVLSYSGENSTYDPDTRLYGEIIDYRASAFTN